MKCNLVVPGFPKCGTSSLHQYLDMHPSVCMSSCKEPHFFARSDLYAEGAQWHDALFEPDQNDDIAYYGESSTSYCYDEAALNRIRKDLENPKIILLLREPVQRVMSHYQWLWALGLESRPFLEAVEEEAERVYSIDNSLLNSGCYATYLRGSNYSHYVPFIEELFGPENVLVLFSEDLKRSPGDILQKAFAFLGLIPFEVKEEIRVNQTSEKSIQRMFGMDRLLGLVPVEVLDFMDPKSNVRNFVKNALGEKRRNLPEITREMRSTLSARLTSDIEFFQTRNSATQ